MVAFTIGLLGLLAFLFGGAMALVGWKDLAKSRLLLATPTSAIAQAPGGGLVEIKGRVVPSEQGVVVGPISGRQGVHVRVVVWESKSRIIDQTQSCEFWVDDGSGEYARVLPAKASFLQLRSEHTQSGVLEDATAPMEAFLRRNAMSSSGALGLNRNLHYSEEMLCVGDPVYAIGPSVRQPAALPARVRGRGRFW
jgi:hypothetical protein